MGQRVVLVRHGHEPADDRVVSWLTRAGYSVDTRKPFAGDTLDKDVEADVAGTVIYGGMYNAYDTKRHTFLNDEYSWIEQCLHAEIPLLGICQGAQMLARHLDAWVGAKEHEIFEFGYYRVDPTEESGEFLDRPMWFTQAHFHTFDLPDGAVRLAKGATYENQAFRYGETAYGLQFHAEVIPDGFRRWMHDKDEVYARPGAQTRADQELLMRQHDPAQADWFHGFLDKLFGRPE